MNDPLFYMKRCLTLAEKGKGNTAPNPMVGAVLVHEDRIIGEGYHAQYGAAHAEVNCLENVAEENRRLIPESIMYVSLEPCSHFGKTPPCAIRLAKEGIKKVIVCNRDPFEKVRGKGFDVLKEHGIETLSDVLHDHGRWLNRRFFCFHEQSRPYIILKWAQTQQGFFAPLNRSRFQMSNRHSQQLVHKWRTGEAAILIGTKTALYDDPLLTARLWQGKQPLRIVMDKKLMLPGSLRIFNGDATTWVINEIKETTHDPIRHVKIDFDKNILQQLLQLLHRENILSLIVEGGADLLNSFIHEGLWDEARIFETANVLEAGINAPLLTNAAKAFEASIDTDMLHVYINKNSTYPYVSEMEL